MEIISKYLIKELVQLGYYVCGTIGTKVGVFTKT